MTEKSLQRVGRIQKALKTAGVDAWLFYGFQNLDPIALRILQFPPDAHLTRRWFYLVPAEGEPRKLVHRIEREALEHLPGSRRTYLRWQSLRSELGLLLEGSRTTAMQYSPENGNPYISRIDAGTMDLVRSLGVEIISSENLIQSFEAVWSPEQLEGHRQTAILLSQIVSEAFHQVAREISKLGLSSERSVQHFILERFHQEKLWTDSPPIVAVNANSGNPHYQPQERNASTIQRDDHLLIDLWAKQAQSDGVFADITWCGCLGAEPGPEVQSIFEIVQQARDAAVSFLDASLGQGRRPQGWEVDDVCREVIVRAGYGESFIHRTGHNLGQAVHGNGVNFDNLETHDTREVIPGIACTIEPGIYLERFGVRSEINVFIGETGVEITTPPQHELLIVIP